MNTQRPILIYYGFPNTYKPISFGHLRSLIVGDFLRRLLTAGQHHTITDLHSNDLGEQLGALMRYGALYPGKIQKHSSVDELHDAFFFIKKKMQQDQTEVEKVLAELITCQNDSKYQHENRKHFYDIFLKNIQIFLKDFNIHVDYYGKESDYLPQLKRLIPQLIAEGLAVQQDGAIVMNASPTLKCLPLMLQHQDGRYLYSGIDLAAAIEHINQFKPRKILYVMTGKQATQMAQVFDAASQLKLNATFFHVRQGDIIPDGTGTPRKPMKLLEKISKLECPGLVFTSQEEKRSFLYAAFKLENLWHNPRNKVLIDIGTFTSSAGYKALRLFATYKWRHADNLQKTDTIKLAQVIAATERTNDLFPVVDYIKQHIKHLANGSENFVESLNELDQLFSILGLNEWQITQIDEASFSQETFFDLPHQPSFSN